MDINQHYAYESYSSVAKHDNCANVEYSSYDGDSFTCHNHDVSSNATDRMVKVVATDIMRNRRILEEYMDITEFQVFIEQNIALDKSLGNSFNYSVFAGNVVFYSVN